MRVLRKTSTTAVMIPIQLNVVMFDGIVEGETAFDTAVTIQYWNAGVVEHPLQCAMRMRPKGGFTLHRVV